MPKNFLKLMIYTKPQISELREHQLYKYTNFHINISYLNCRKPRQRENIERNMILKSLTTYRGTRIRITWDYYDFSSESMLSKK